MINRILDFLFPRVCPVCGGRLSLSEEQLCICCIASLPLTGYSECTKRNSLKDMFELKIPIERAGALMRYMPGSDSAEIILKIKYQKGRTLARYMGRMLAEAYNGCGFFEGISLIVPVPLTKKRFRERGYNQAEEIALGISDVTGIAVETKAVKRTVFRESQTRLSHQERNDNVKGAFACTAPQLLNGKHILLIDDVITTGSTVLSLADTIVAHTDNILFSVMSIGVTGDLRYF